MSDPSEFVTTRELRTEMRAMRWEMRALILAAAIANLSLAYGLHIPPVPEAVNLVLSIF